MSYTAACNCTGACRVPPYRCTAQSNLTMDSPIGHTDLVTCQNCGALHMRIAVHTCAKIPSFYQPMPRPADGVFTIPQTSHQMGCICPPGANRDCEAPLCPRKNHLKAKE